MRISDWSSDVCSSDLHGQHQKWGLYNAKVDKIKGEKGGWHHAHLKYKKQRGNRTGRHDVAAAEANNVARDEVARVGDTPVSVTEEIGRARCSERGWP